MIFRQFAIKVQVRIFTSTEAQRRSSVKHIAHQSSLNTLNSSARSHLEWSVWRSNLFDDLLVATHPDCSSRVKFAEDFGLQSKRLVFTNPWLRRLCYEVLQTLAVECKQRRKVKITRQFRRLESKENCFFVGVRAAKAKIVFLKYTRALRSLPLNLSKMLLAIIDHTSKLINAIKHDVNTHWTSFIVQTTSAQIHD